MKNFVFLLLTVVILTGCASSSPTVNLSYTNRIDLPELPRPMTLLEVHWNVQNIDQLIEMLRIFGIMTDAEATIAKERAKTNAHNATFSQFALDGKSYESLVLNMAELRRYLEQQQIVIEYFIRATEPTRTSTGSSTSSTTSTTRN